MKLYDPMDNRNVPTFDLEDEDLPSLHRVILIVCEEKEVSPEECRLHTTTTKKEQPSVRIM